MIREMVDGGNRADGGKGEQMEALEALITVYR
jgi:hypothetical protein